MPYIDFANDYTPGEVVNVKDLPSVTNCDVNHPSHYNQTTIECIEVIEALNLGFHLGNALKYIWRANHKGATVKDLKKAIWYIERQIQLLEKNNA